MDTAMKAPSRFSKIFLTHTLAALLGSQMAFAATFHAGNSEISAMSSSTAEACDSLCLEWVLFAEELRRKLMTCSPKIAGARVFAAVRGDEAYPSAEAATSMLTGAVTERFEGAGRSTADPTRRTSSTSWWTEHTTRQSL